MDGFHLDNRILRARGLLDRKGAPETFDICGLLKLVARLRDEDEVIFPVFDRSLDAAIAGAGVVHDKCKLVVVEGNYLLLDAPRWRDLSSYWDVSVYLKVPDEELRRRLIDRWLAHGLSFDNAVRRAEGNDLLNAKMVSVAIAGRGHIVLDDDCNE